MKSVYAVLLLASLLALAHAYPGAIRDSDESLEIDTGDRKDGVLIVLPQHNIFGDDDDASLPSPWRPFRFDNNPFESLLTRMQESMNRIRAQMEAALSSQLGQGGLPWIKIPEGANTTSTTKIIGDHSVTINETTYSDGDENGGTIFRVRVVDVKPLNETATDENKDESSEETTAPAPSASPSSKPSEDNNRREELSTTPASRSVETVEEFDNEINNGNQVEILNA